MLVKSRTPAPDLLGELSATIGRVERAIAGAIPEPNLVTPGRSRDLQAEARRLLELANDHARLEEVRQDQRERAWRWQMTRILDVVGLVCLLLAAILGAAGVPVLHVAMPAATSLGAVGVPRVARLWTKSRP